jgi:hypothetical protein
LLREALPWQKRRELAMANNQPSPEALAHADLSRPATELSAAEKAELKRRYDTFMRHFRASELGSTPAAGKPRRIRKWHP